MLPTWRPVLNATCEHAVCICMCFVLQFKHVFSNNKCFYKWKQICTNICAYSLIQTLISLHISQPEISNFACKIVHIFPAFSILCTHVWAYTYAHNRMLVEYLLVCVRIACVDFSITGNCLLILALSFAIHNFQLYYAILYSLLLLLL